MVASVSTMLSASSSSSLVSPLRSSPFSPLGEGQGLGADGFPSSGTRVGCCQNGNVRFRFTWRKKVGGTGWTVCIKCLQMRNRLRIKEGQVQTHLWASGLYLSFNGIVIGVAA